MKVLNYFFVILAHLLTYSNYAQGRIYFATHAEGAEKIDGPARFAPTGELLGDGYYAQLFAAPEGSSLSALRPYGPVVPFRDRVPGYIRGPEIEIPDMGPNSYALVVIRAFNGSSYEASNIRGESNAFLVLLGNIGIGPGSLTGIQPFTVDIIPEPAVAGLVVFGCGVLWGWKRRRGAGWGNL